MEKTSLLVIGAGPYGVSVAARALERGIPTVVIGRPMGFWTDHMPAGMCLRSGLDWHLDAAGVDTFEAFVEETGLGRDEIDPIPIAVFLDYAAWFQTRKRISVRNNLVTRIATRADGPGGFEGFEVRLDDGSEIVAEKVVAAPGVAYFQHLPDWAGHVPTDRGAHTCRLTHFEDLVGARVLIVGGRQSAYEWAALIGEHGAERVDIVHRHPVPRFERVSWAFVDAYVDATVRGPGMVAVAAGVRTGKNLTPVLGGGPSYSRMVAYASLERRPLPSLARSRGHGGDALFPGHCEHHPLEWRGSHR